MIMNDHGDDFDSIINHDFHDNGYNHSFSNDELAYLYDHNDGDAYDDYD